MGLCRLFSFWNGPFSGGKFVHFRGGVHDFQSFSDLQFSGFVDFLDLRKMIQFEHPFQLGFETMCYKDYYPMMVMMMMMMMMMMNILVHDQHLDNLEKNMGIVHASGSFCCWYFFKDHYIHGSFCLDETWCIISMVKFGGFPWITEPKRMENRRLLRVHQILGHQSPKHEGTVGSHGYLAWSVFHNP